MLASGLTASDTIQLAIAVITGLATAAALGTLFITRANERRRNQPIVIAHEAGRRRFAGRGEGDAAWVVDAYLTSEGGGPAFNVRFGVEFANVRYPYRLDVQDPETGNLQRVLPAGGRRPESGSWAIPIPSLSLLGRAADTLKAGKPDTLDAERVYWARYENAEGQTWETRNPGDRSSRLDIRRIKKPERHEEQERLAYNDALERDVEWEREVLADLQEQRRRMIEAAEGQGRSNGDNPDEPSPETRKPRD